MKSANTSQVKLNILNATLDLIKTKGMRSVRHRAVAELAGVSLGSTTYHFKSLDDLISSTFIHWYEQNGLDENPIFQSIKEDIMHLSKGDLEVTAIAQQIFAMADKYLRSQIFDFQGDRLVELAFHNEALRNEQLAKVLLSSWSNQVQRLTNFFQLLGTVDPNSDAEITFSLIMQMEKRALLIKDITKRELEYEKMRLVLKRHIYLTLGV